MSLDIEKIVSNSYHAILILISAYIAAHPSDYAWLIPVLQTLGQTAPPPNFTPGPIVEKLPNV